MRFAYLGALLVAIAGCAVLDRRFRLALWHDRRRAVVTVLVGVVGFLLWDAAGLVLGIFARGESPHMTGWEIAPELPVEEVFFLLLLCYDGLLVFRGAQVARAALARRRERAAAGRAGADGTGTGSTEVGA